MQPIKTEYDGIVFDSKSEAVFARTLHVVGLSFEYHSMHCGHEWDFLVTGIPKAILVEYKPKPPTDTYIKNLTEITRRDPAESAIVWGNPWDGMLSSAQRHYSECCYVIYPIFLSGSKYGWGDFIRQADNGEEDPCSNRHSIFNIFGICEDAIREAMRYRFDLR